MKIVDKTKFIVRILELIVIIATITLTPMAIKYATEIRGYKAFGGEYLVPLFGVIIIILIETVYDAIKESKKEKSKNGNSNTREKKKKKM